MVGVISRPRLRMQIYETRVWRLVKLAAAVIVNSHHLVVH